MFPGGSASGQMLRKPFTTQNILSDRDNYYTNDIPCKITFKTPIPNFI